MIFRYQATILDHTVSIRTNSSGRHELSIEGPFVSANHTESFLSLHDAKREAHPFAHSALRTACDCGGAPQWSIVPNL